MCSIIASYDSTKLKKLIKLNQFRGNFSYSYTTINKHNKPTSQLKTFGEFNNHIVNSNTEYKIAHVQAPTGGMIKDENRIHPVTNKIDNTNMLWHNGLLTPRGIKFLQDKLETEEIFDTKLLFDAINKFGFNILSEIEGLFSCLYIINGTIFIFRTKHGKLYIDEDMNISSERFEGSKCINSDIIYEINLIKKDLSEFTKFRTKRFNYIIKGEL